MTQDQLRLLTLASLACLALAVFELTTLVCIVVAAYLSFLYLRRVARTHLRRGLIELCPERLKYQLLNRSIFDFICSLWFRDSFIFIKKFFKILVKPLVEPIDPENALEALNDFDEETKRVYLTKGVVRVMPGVCQNVILGSERAEAERAIEEERRTPIKMGKMIEEGSSERHTWDMSQGASRKKLIRATSQSNFNNCSIIVKDRWSGEGSQHQILQSRRIPGDSPALRLKKPKPKGILRTLQNSMSMVKKLIEMQNIAGNIQKVDNKTIFKIMLVFWVSLVIQVRFNQKSRKSVIKMLYVMGSMITVMGIVGTSGILVYKHWNRRRRDSQISECDQ